MFFASLHDWVISGFFVFAPDRKHINKTMWHIDKFHQKVYNFRMQWPHKDSPHGPFKQFKLVIIHLFHILKT